MASETESAVTDEPDELHSQGTFIVGAVAQSRNQWFPFPQKYQ
ncbi:MAG: hypothetical protein ACLTI1_11795 [Clostridia bacterium]